ncbi:hypothetical protein GCM10009000_121080 [Halobacterium noricense]
MDDHSVPSDDDKPTQIPEDVIIEKGDTIRSEVSGYIHDLLRQWSTESPFLVHFKTTQGTGKTTGGMDAVEIKGPAAAFGPRHVDIDEDADRFGERYSIRFVGKDKACTNDRFKDKHSSVSKEVSKDWCDGCPERDRCEYFEPFNQIENETRSLTAPHNYLEIFPDILDQWDEIEVILIDETPWYNIFEKAIQIGAQDITHTRSALRNLDEGNKSDSETIEDSLLLLDTMSSALTDEDGGEKQSNRAYKLATGIDFSELSTELTEIHDERVLDGTDYTDAIVAIADNLEEVERTTHWASEQGIIDECDSPPDELWGVDNSTKDNASFELRWRNFDLMEIARQKPVFVLATEMPTESVEAIFELPVVTVEDTVSPDAEVIQLDSRMAGITRLRKRNQTFENLVEFTRLALRRECATGRKTLIGVKKALKDDVREQLQESGFVEGDDFELGYYYGMTGSNRFEDCDAFVGFGTPGLSNNVTDTSSVVSGVSEKILQQEGREGELRDAIHRIRPARMEATPRVYLFTNAVDLSSDFSGTYERFNTPDIRSKLTQQVETAERQSRIQKFIRDSSPDPTITQMVKTLPYGHSTLTSELRHLNKQGVTESHEDTTKGRGNNPTRYRLISS